MPATATLTERKTFDIRDYTDRLTPAKGRNRYICPVCDGNDFTIEPKSGKYQCWNNRCDNAEIRNAIAPLDNGALSTWKPRKVIALRRKTPKPAPLPQKIQLARLPENRQYPQKQQGSRRDRELGNCQTRTIQYQYGEGLYVERVEFYQNGERTKKICIPYHINDLDNVEKGKGERPWPLYRFDELKDIPLADRSILWGEGEKVVEASRFLGFASVTPPGSGWTESEIERYVSDLKSSGVTGIVVVPDLDPEGEKKAQLVKRCAAKHQFPVLPLDLGLVATDEEMEGIKGFDIADLVELRLKSQSPEEIAKELECAIQLSFDEIRFGGGGDDGGDDGDGGDGDGGDRNDPNLVSGAETFENNCLETLFAQDWVVLDGAFYQYLASSGYWEHQNDAAVKKILADKAKRSYQLVSPKPDAPPIRKYCFSSESKIKSAFGFARAYLTEPKPPANEHLIAFLNGTLDVRTGELQPHNRSNFMTWGIATEYEPNADIPAVFENFLTKSYGADLIPLIRAIASMLLDPSAPYGYFPHALGASGSGKGVLLRFLASLFSEDSASSISSFGDVGTKESRHQTLTGTKFAYISDIGGYVKGVRSFYELVDNGPLTGRGLYNSDAYNRRWNVRFAVASVDHLQIENAGDGWDRRCIPLPTKPRKGKPDPGLEQKLRECRAEVISWALAMPREERDNILINARSLFPQIAKVKRSAELYGDSAKSFIDACLTSSDRGGVQIPSGELYALYRSYCKASGHHPNGYQKFVSHLKNVLPNNYRQREVAWENGKTVTKMKAHWTGIALAAENIFFGAVDGGLPSAYRFGWVGEATEEMTINCILSNVQEGGLASFEEPDTSEEICEKRLLKVEAAEDYSRVHQDFGQEAINLAWGNLAEIERSRITQIVEGQRVNEVVRDDNPNAKTGEEDSQQENKPHQKKESNYILNQRLNREFKRLGWDSQQQSDYIAECFGKSRNELSDEEIESLAIALAQLSLVEPSEVEETAIDKLAKRLETCTERDFQQVCLKMNSAVLEDAIALVNDYARRRVLENWQGRMQRS